MLAINLSNTLSRALGALAGSLSASDPIQKAHAAVLDSNTYVSTVNELCATARASNAARKPTACRVNKASSRYARATAGLTLSSAFVASVKGDVKATGYLRVLVGEMGKAQVKAGEEETSEASRPLVVAGEKVEENVEATNNLDKDASSARDSSNIGKTSFSRLFIKSKTSTTPSFVPAAIVGIFGNSATRFSQGINVKTAPHFMQGTPSSSKIVPQLKVYSPVAWSTDSFTALKSLNAGKETNEHVAAPHLALILRSPGTMVVHRAHHEPRMLANQPTDEHSIEVETSDADVLAATTATLVELDTEQVVEEAVVQGRALVALNATPAEQQLITATNNNAADELAVAVRSPDTSSLGQSPTTDFARLAELLSYDATINPREVPGTIYHTSDNSVVRSLIDAVKAWRRGNMRLAKIELQAAVDIHGEIERWDVFCALFDVGYTIMGSRRVERLAIAGEARWGRTLVAPRNCIEYSR